MINNFFKLRVHIEWVIEDTVWAILYYISKGVIFFVEQIDQFPQKKVFFIFNYNS